MNILLVIPSLALGGAEVFVVRLANCLSKRGNNVFLLDINPDRRSPLLTARIAPEVNLIHFDKSISFIQKLIWKIIFTISRFTNKLLFKSIQLRKRQDAKKLSRLIESLVQQYKIQVVNSHLASADWMVTHYFATHTRNQKFIISMHGCYNQDDVYTNPGKKQLHRDMQRGLELADHIVLLTKKNALPLKGLQLRNKPVYIPLGFEAPAGWATNTEIQAPAYSITFGLVSRAVARKGWEEAISATQKLQKGGINCRLILVGGSEYQQKLQQQFDHLPYIQFVGAASQVLGYVSQFDVGLFPSCIESESFPNTVIEYLACGKPVIGTDIGEVKNMISTPEGEYAGRLLDYDSAGISIKQLVNFMREYGQDKGMLSEHSRLAKIAFKKFDMIKCVEAYEAVYR